MKNKKLLAIALMSILSISTLVGCSQNSNDNSSQPESSTQENNSNSQSAQNTDEPNQKRIYGTYSSTVENTKFIYTFNNDGSGKITDTSSNTDTSIGYAFNNKYLFLSAGSIDEVAVFEYSMDGSNVVLSPIGEDNTKQILEPAKNESFSDSTVQQYTKISGTFETNLNKNKVKMTFNEDGTGTSTLNNKDSFQFSFAQNNTQLYIIEQATGEAINATYTFDGNKLVINESDGSTTTYNRV